MISELFTVYLTYFSTFKVEVLIGFMSRDSLTRSLPPNPGNPHRLKNRGPVPTMSYGGGTPIGDGGGTTYGGGSGRENRISADQVNETKPFSLFVCAFLCSLGTPPPKTTTVSDNISHAQTHHHPIFFFFFGPPCTHSATTSSSSL